VQFGQQNIIRHISSYIVLSQPREEHAESDRATPKEGNSKLHDFSAFIRKSSLGAYISILLIKPDHVICQWVDSGGLKTRQPPSVDSCQYGIARKSSRFGDLLLQPGLEAPKPGHLKSQLVAIEVNPHGIGCHAGSLDAINHECVGLSPTTAGDERKSYA
jgi:hypothetical protein